MKKFNNFFLIVLLLITFFSLIINKESIIEVNTSLEEENNLILINKNNSLDPFFVPKNLFFVEDIDSVREIFLKESCYFALLRFNQNLIKNKVFITLFSGYRSYNYQESIFKDEKYQAKPGQSEHQTGLAIDLSLRNYGLTLDFSKTKEYQYLKENCHKYGFILRYQDKKKNITLYPFEPWHFRYVGVKASTYMYNNNLCLEEYIELKTKK